MANSTSVSLAGIEPLVARIRQAFKKWDDQAIRKQKRSFQFATLSSLLIPVAVLLLTIQIQAFPEAGVIAVILITLELAVLLFALLILVLRLAPRAGEWAHDRLRAEILRREEFLLRGRIGPYLDKKIFVEIEAALEIRLKQIDSLIQRPHAGLPLAGDTPWRDELEDKGRGLTASPEPDFAESFRKERLRGQFEWYCRKGRRFVRLDARYENVIRLTLAFALVLAAMHLVILLLGKTSTWGGETIRLVIEIAAIALPPVGAAAAALQALFQRLRVGCSYLKNASEIDAIDREFLELTSNHKKQIAEIETIIAADERKRRLDEEQAEYEFRLKRIVLRTEEVLAQELRSWYFIMRPGLSEGDVHFIN